MATMDKTLLKEILENISAVNAFLNQDLNREKLSHEGHLRRKSLAQNLDVIMKKINSTHPSIRPRVNTPGTMAQPPPMAPKPPPAIPTEADEGQEMYEEPQISQPNPQDYLDFEPGTDGPQEDYLDMGAGEDRIEEETYEDPAQTMQQEEEEQDMYEEPQTNISVMPPLPSANTSTSSLLTQPPTSANEQDTQFLEPTAGANYTGSRNSMSLSEADWSDAYDTNTKKGEKIRVSDLSNVTHKGWLEKLGGRNQRNWQKRFCVVSGVFMYFFEKENSKTYNNRIGLPNYIPNPANELTNVKKKHFALKLSAAVLTKDSKDYYFRLTSDDDRTKWIDALRAAFEIGRVGAGGTGIACTLPRMPSTSPSLLHNDQAKPRAVSVGGDMEQEEYEAVTAVIAEEEEEQDDYVAVNPSSELPTELQDGPEEDYVDLQPTDRERIEEEIEEEEPDRPIPPQLPPPPMSSARSQPQLPPPPASSQPQLPPLPMPSARSQPQLPPPPASPQLPPPPVSRGQPQLPPPPSSTRGGPPQLPPLPRAPQQPLPSPPRAPQQPLPPPPSSSSTPRSYVPRPDPVVDTTKDYVQQPNGIHFSNVYMILWDFAASDKDEMDLKRGDLVFVAENKGKQEWLFGELVDPNVSRRLGPKGLFPASYSAIAFQLIQ